MTKTPAPETPAFGPQAGRDADPERSAPADIAVPKSPPPEPAPEPRPQIEVEEAPVRAEA